MLAHGDERALAGMNEHPGRIGGDPTLPVEQCVGRDRNAPVQRHPGLAHGDLGGRHVQQHRRRIVGAGDGHAERVGTEAGVGTAVWRDERRVAGHVHEMDRRQPGPSALLTPVADASDVKAVAQPHHGHPVGAGPLDGQLGGLVAHDLTEPGVAVEHGQRGVVDDGRHVLVDLQAPAGGSAHVGGQHADPVRIVPDEVGAHELIGHERGLPVLAAQPQAHAVDEGVKPIGVHHAHNSSPHSGHGTGGTLAATPKPGGPMGAQQR